MGTSCIFKSNRVQLHRQFRYESLHLMGSCWIATGDGRAVEEVVRRKYAEDRPEPFRWH